MEPPVADKRLADPALTEGVERFPLPHVMKRLVAFSFVVIAASLRADVSLPALFSDGIVLQQT